MNTTAIAQHLNIASQAIIEVQEWAQVIWVRFVGGCRFVSKQVIKVLDTSKASENVRTRISAYFKFVQQGKQKRADYQVELLKSWLRPFEEQYPETVSVKDSPTPPIMVGGKMAQRQYDADCEVIESFLASI